ncbi:4,5-DOPA dioxygenase extradiol [Phenylobacterium sp.]|uniref:4,5-DOPA-extradiol-dioxygenase n=1 Tax=Phenylobacterium sp. TaxID=1871053 RepID=UPI0030F44C50
MSTSSRMPVVFVGHGSPMNALGGPNAQVWRDVAASLPRPKAILAISAHWRLDETAVTAMAAPKTIHDFGGFPQPLFDMQYPAPGDASLAARTAELLAPMAVRADQDWGLDHGTWSVLAHMYPDADVPVVQLAMDLSHPLPAHYDRGKRLAPLRDEGVLILGSGDVVHNLRAAVRAENAAPLAWAQHFHDAVRDRLSAGDHAALIDPAGLGPAARMAVDEHYLPLLYVLGASQPGEAVSLFNDHIDLGSISMLGARIG